MNTNNTVKKALSFVKGLTNSPSDFISSDDELTESAGMIMKNGEMIPIQKPTLVLDTDKGELKFIHKTADQEIWVFFDKSAGQMSVYDNTDADNGEFTQTLKLESFISCTNVANTLVITTNKGILYMLLEKGKYKVLGYGLPDYEFLPRFTHLPNKLLHEYVFHDYNTGEIGNEAVLSTPRYAYSNRSSHIDGTASGNTDKSLPLYRNYTSFTARSDGNFDTVIEGTISKALNNIKEKKGFTNPFFLRAALKLYDGTYAKISTPIICFPTIGKNLFSTGNTYFNEDSKIHLVDVYFHFYVMEFKSFYFYIENGNDWSDIIKEVVVFKTEDVLPFYLEEGWDFVDLMKTQDMVHTEIFQELGMKYEDERDVGWFNYIYKTDQKNLVEAVLPKVEKTESEIIKELLAKTQFYKLFSVKFEKVAKTPQLPENALITDTFLDIMEDRFTPVEIERHVVENLTSQEQLPNDDYYEWTTKYADRMFTYNKRLNIIPTKRKPYNGYRFPTACMQIFNSSKSSTLYSGFNPEYANYFTYYVHIKSNGYDDWVRVPAFNTPDVLWMAGSWFYYPDPNAVEVRIINNAGKGFSFKLEQHPRLNGAYCFYRLPSPYNDERPEDYKLSDIERPVVGGTLEHFDSQILTSVVNNPFVFQANGDNTVGTGSIIGIIANTEPISQGQFGQYPLLVFTTEGIYALSVDAEGLYASSYPMSREVCNNAESITPTDRLVFFTSEKGLMAISGGTAQCVSTQLSGPTPNAFKVIGDGDFRKFLANCRIAYDYRESLLRIYSPDYIYHYVYNITDQTFAKAENEENTLLAVASSYPDNLVQEVGGKVYSMLAKPDINADTRTYSGTFITRPLKLGSSLELKTIRQILHFFNSEEGKLQLRVFGSNDCRTWRELKSIHGKPWLFYTFQYDLSNLSASDSFAGTALAIETRFNDKMR